LKSGVFTPGSANEETNRVRQADTLGGNEAWNSAELFRWFSEEVVAKRLPGC